MGGRSSASGSAVKPRSSWYLSSSSGSCVAGCSSGRSSPANKYSSSGCACPGWSGDGSSVELFD